MTVTSQAPDDMGPSPIFLWWAWGSAVLIGVTLASLNFNVPPFPSFLNPFLWLQIALGTALTGAVVGIGYVASVLRRNGRPLMGVAAVIVNVGAIAYTLLGIWRSL